MEILLVVKTLTVMMVMAVVMEMVVMEARMATVVVS